MNHAVKMGVGRIVKPAHLRPSDQGREMSLEEFEHASGQEGYDYELIDGRVEVSPKPEWPHNELNDWVIKALWSYSLVRAEFINKVTYGARVHLPGRRPASCPEPDVAAFRLTPRRLSIKSRTWHTVSPLLVVEVVSPDNSKKDLERNVGLYLEVPSIREYWIVDGRPDPDEPKLIVYRRRGQKWQKLITVPFGETYETKLLPGFKLLVDPNENE